MSDNTSSHEPMSRNCGNCRHAVWGRNSIRGRCFDRFPYVTLSIYRHFRGVRVPCESGTNCPTWQAKEAAAKAGSAVDAVTCIGCELDDNCPGFNDCPKLAAAKEPR